jgi:hypothetical protein
MLEGPQESLRPMSVAPKGYDSKYDRVVTKFTKIMFIPVNRHNQATVSSSAFQSICSTETTSATSEYSYVHMRILKKISKVYICASSGTTSTVKTRIAPSRTLARK